MGRAPESPWGEGKSLKTVTFVFLSFFKHASNNSRAFIHNFSNIEYINACKTAYFMATRQILARHSIHGSS